MSRHPWSVNPEDLVLPSGITVKIKPVRMQLLTRIGVVSPELMAAISGEADDPQANFTVMAAVAERALVEPRVTSDPKKVNEGKGVFSLDLIPDDDLVAIFSAATGGTEQDESFRDDGPGDGAGTDSEVLGVSA